MSADPPGGTVRRIVRNALSLLVGNAAGEALTGYAIYLAASRLGPTSFGRLSAAQAFIEPFETFAAFGLGQVIMRFAAERKAADGTIRGTLLGIRVAFAVVACALVIIVAGATHRTDLLPILALLCVGTLTQPFAAAAGLPYDFEQAAHRRMYLPTIVASLRVGTAIWAARAMPTPVGFQLSASVAGLLSVALAVLLSRRHFPTVYVFDRELAKRLLRLGWAAAVTDVVAMTYLRGAYLVLHDQPHELGMYAAADRLVRPILTVSALFVVSSVPTIARMVQERRSEALRSVLGTAMTRTVLYSLPAVALAWLLAPYILRWLAPAYADAVWSFRLLSLSVLFIVVTQIAYVFLITMGRTRAIMAVACGNFVIYFALARWLAPRHGAPGAAFATTTMEAINMLLQIALAFYFLRAEARPSGDSGGLGA